MSHTVVHRIQWPDETSGMILKAKKLSVRIMNGPEREGTAGIWFHDIKRRRKEQSMAHGSCLLAPPDVCYHLRLSRAMVIAIKGDWLIDVTRRILPGCSRRGVKLSSAGVKPSYMLSLYSFDPR